MKKVPVFGLALLVGVAVLLLAPVPLPPTRIHNSVTIARAPAEVYAYVTTPANWPRWHPSSLAVSGATDHPLRVGEQVGEDFLVAGYRGRVTWTVTQRQAPALWTISGKIDDGGSGRVNYRLTAVAGGTLFERDFDYARPNLLFVLADSFRLRRLITAESAEALRRLKAALEGGAAA
ncbi:SRPBCC family protein [Rugamonas sp.]|uniref:SRPBCC family protein n=1 Tax=Rugamonas sp. TaxID=1926287 RepID=UPI0025F95E0C|nr:SRPBCC family protein [Rugamonas sp.]